jgi:DNA-binding transcriptional MerR regulator
VSKELSIREVAAATGVTPHTLRYYERIGLLARVGRAKSGHRRYGPDDVRWIEFLRKLHDTGMPIRRMLEYARLLRRGDSTFDDRLKLLEAHGRDVEARVTALSENLALIRKKIRWYDSQVRAREPAVAAR